MKIQESYNKFNVTIKSRLKAIFPQMCLLIDKHV